MNKLRKEQSTLVKSLPGKRDYETQDDNDFLKKTVGEMEGWSQGQLDEARKGSRGRIMKHLYEDLPGHRISAADRGRLPAIYKSHEAIMADGRGGDQSEFLSIDRSLAGIASRNGAGTESIKLEAATIVTEDRLSQERVAKAKEDKAKRDAAR
jgi:hypothetical protein